MSQQLEVPAGYEQERTRTGLRPKRNPQWHLLNFFRTKPLGAVGAVMAFIIVLIALFAPVIQNHDPYITDHRLVYGAPSAENYLGGDNLGRDVFSRVVAGSRISIRVGLISALLGCAIGLLLGVSSAYFGGLYDLVLQRIIDAMIAFPALVLAMALMAALGSSINNVIIALSIVFMPTTARIIRSQALAINEMDYVLAAHAVGANSVRIIVRHMVPNLVAIWFVTFTFLMGGRGDCRGFPELPGFRCWARCSLLGWDAQERYEELHRYRTLAPGGAGPGDRRCCLLLERLGRLPPRRPGPQTQRVPIVAKAIGGEATPTGASPCLKRI